MDYKKFKVILILYLFIVTRLYSTEKFYYIVFLWDNYILLIKFKSLQLSDRLSISRIR